MVYYSAGNRLFSFLQVCFLKSLHLSPLCPDRFHTSRGRAIDTNHSKDIEVVFQVLLSLVFCLLSDLTKVKGFSDVVNVFAMQQKNVVTDRVHNPYTLQHLEYTIRTCHQPD